jgi:hypothetical protein
MTSSRVPIQTAVARSGGQPLTIPVDLGETFGGVVEYQFNPNVGMEMIDAMDQFVILRQQVRDGQATMQAMYGAMNELLDLTAYGDTAERIAADLRERRLDLPTLLALGQEVIGELTGAHPTRRSPSLDPSPQAGEGSTDGAAATVSTPPLSPPIVS